MLNHNQDQNKENEMSQLDLNQVMDAGTAKPTRRTICRLGFWTSILTAITAAAALGIAITTAPARSGPNCPPLVDMGVLESCVTYPYTDVADYVPVEYIWMVPALLLALLFAVQVICIHHYTAVDKKVFSQIAVSFAVVAAAVHAINYFIQLVVVQPSLLKSELEGLALFSQYNPHGIFIALEDLGYLMMGIAFLFVAVAFARRDKLERAIRFVLIAGAVVAVGGLVLLALLYGSDLEYRYEVLSLTFDWIVLIVSGTLLSVFFRRAGRSAQL
jgi:hypothetical protein